MQHTQGDAVSSMSVAAQGVTWAAGTVFVLLHVLPLVGSGPDTLNDRVWGLGLRTRGPGVGAWRRWAG